MKNYSDFIAKTVSILKGKVSGSSRGEGRTHTTNSVRSFEQPWTTKNPWRINKEYKGRLLRGHDAIDCLLANTSHCSLRPINLQQSNKQNLVVDVHIKGVFNDSTLFDYTKERREKNSHVHLNFDLKSSKFNSISKQAQYMHPILHLSKRW